MNLTWPQEGLKSEVRRIQHVIRAGLNEPQEGGRAYTVGFGRASMPQEGGHEYSV